MSNAENALLVGTSAGGLATILNCDRFHTFLPGACRVKCISDSGFFIRAEHLRGAQDDTTYYFRDIVSFHELVQFYQSHAHKDLLQNCVFSRKMWSMISGRLPNSPNEVGWNSCTQGFSNLSSCTDNQQHLIMDFQTIFLKTLEKLDDNPSRGLFITSCYEHDFIYKIYWQGTPTLQNKTIQQAVGDCVLTEGFDPPSPECVNIFPPDCLDTFYHEMCKYALAPVDISSKCCDYIVQTLEYNCYTFVLVKQVVDMHLCDDNLGAGRGQTIWDNCNGIYI
ncbi:[Wnt protein] O-palmitoleoyl-L-serine hydrolase [Salvia divinorum]|uniref:Pectin acetylesterase n=1 Tax=Salvia divinorum TaxID=28513 RepID=A0ABD1GCR9_SALDI